MFFVNPDEFADTAFALTRQKPSAWPFEVETRPFGCNAHICELITPAQTSTRLELMGPSSIHLEDNFFSEFTTVTMAYGSWEFNITDL